MYTTLAKRISVAVAVAALGIVGAVPSGAQTTSTSTTTTAAPTTTTTAAPAVCVATFSPNPAPVGAEVTITVTGLLPGEDVEAVVDGTSLGTSTANSSGVISESLGSVPGEAAGLHAHFNFVGQQSGATCSAVLTFGPAPAPAPKAPAVAAKAAFTG
jgi:hypothetical protein